MSVHVLFAVNSPHGVPFERMEAESLKVSFVSDGWEAFNMVTAMESGKHPVHLVVSDYRLAGMDMTELIGRLAERRPAVPVILLVASSDQLSSRGLHEFPNVLKVFFYPFAWAEVINAVLLGLRGSCFVDFETVGQDDVLRKSVKGSL